MKNQMFNKKEEKRNQWIFAVFCVALLFLAFKTAAQNVKGVYNDHTYITPKKPLAFSLLNNHKDTLYLTIFADSVSHPVYSLMLYSYYTKGFATPDKGVKIWFKDGTCQEFEPIEVNKEQRYVRYNIVGNSFEKLHKNETEAIHIPGVLLCLNPPEKRYFMDFLDSYNK